jgi:hypothetical protein
MLYALIFDDKGNRRFSREFMHAWWVSIDHGLSLDYGPQDGPFSYDSFLAYCAGGEL